jgi:hypothetical protein
MDLLTRHEETVAGENRGADDRERREVGIIAPCNLHCRRGIRCECLGLRLEKLAKRREFRRARRTRTCQAKRPLKPRVRSACLARGSFGESQRALGEDRIVHDGERLQRRVRRKSARLARLARACIEAEQSGRGNGSLPMCVKTSAMCVLARVSGVAAVGTRVGDQIRLLVWLDARASDLLDQESRGKQRRVPEHLGWIRLWPSSGETLR